MKGASTVWSGEKATITSKPYLSLLAAKKTRAGRAQTLVTENKSNNQNN